MRNLLWFLAVAVLMLPSLGCKSNPPSMNKRVGLTDGVVSVAVAVALDEVSADKYADAKAEVIKICSDLQAFLKTGKVADLPVAVVEQAMLKMLADKGWGKYSSIVRSLFDYVEAVSVDTGKLGTNNVILIDLGLQEAIDAAMRSRFEWRPPQKEPDSAPPAAVGGG